MDYEQARTYLLSKPAAVEDYPFGVDVMVPKIKGKMFATLAYNGDDVNMNLKCDPNEANSLRDIFSGVTEAYHMNKRHWITVDLSGDVPDGEIERLIDNSYSLVVKNLKKVERESLELSYGKDNIYID
jgi:predicted DNA-binding protein (MmcQ/YjbR family)